MTIGFGVDAGIHVDLFGFFHVDWRLPGAPYDIASWVVDHAQDYPPDPPKITIPLTTLDFTRFLSNPADFQWSAKVVEPEGDDVCSGQGSVTWYSSILKDGKREMER